MNGKPIGIKRGHLTYKAEGNDYIHSPFYSRVIHYPGNGNSGVTIGRGYDMGQRSGSEIYHDLRKAGVEPDKAQAIAGAAGLTGAQAAHFVQLNRDKIGEIAEYQQINLFNQTYSVYEKLARNNYNSRTASMANRTEWSELHPAIRDVLVDFIYQGFKGEKGVPIAARNNIDDLMNFIKNTP